MFSGLTMSDIITSATTFTSELDGVTQTVVGLGVGFAVVSFIKGLFF